MTLPATAAPWLTSDAAAPTAMPELKAAFAAASLDMTPSDLLVLDALFVGRPHAAYLVWLLGRVAGVSP